MSVRKWILLVVLAAFLWPGLLSAEVKTWTQSAKEGSASMKDLVPRLASDEAYSDRYTFDAEFDGGGRIEIEMTVSNLGWGDHHGGAVVRAVLPNGKKYVYAEKFDEGDWTFAKDKLDLNIGKLRLTGKGKRTFVIKHTGKTPFELTFKSRLPMWSPGNGAIEVDGKKFALTLIAPRADVQGKFKIGKEWVPVKSTGRASGDHNFTQFAPFDLAQRFSRFQDFNGDVFVAWRDIKLTKENGGKSITWLVVGYKNQIVFQDASARLRTSNNVKDGRSGYTVPKAVQVDGKRGKDNVKLVIRGSTYESIDLLKDYNSAVKMVAQAVSKPYQISFSGSYTLQMTIKGATATIKGKRAHSMDYMN